MKVKLLSRVRLFTTPWTVTYHAPRSMGFSRQEYWSGLPFPSPGDLPNLGIEPSSSAEIHQPDLPKTGTGMGFPSDLDGKASAMQETQVRSLGWEDPLEKEMATHSSTLAWKIPWTEEPGRLQSMGLQRVGHD